MKHLGLDLGSKTCGIAISDEFGMLARNLTTLRFEENNYELALKMLLELANKEKVKTMVLGYPKHMNGDLGDRAKISEEFKEKIESNSDIKVFLYDERLTSITVNKMMITANLSREKRKQKKDELAAVVILQNYLDQK